MAPWGLVSAKAALHHDGSVSTWGGRSSGGDSSAVKEQLVAVQELRVHESLVGGLEHFLFFHILGIIIPTDFHIFQRGRSTTNQVK